MMKQMILSASLISILNTSLAYGAMIAPEQGGAAPSQLTLALQELKDSVTELSQALQSQSSPPSNLTKSGTFLPAMFKASPRGIFLVLEGFFKGKW